MGSGGSYYDEQQLSATLQRLAAQQRFLLDASTLIILDKAGLLQVIMPELPCETIQEVANEVGDTLIAHAGIDVRPACIPTTHNRRPDTDSLLFSTAQTEKLALVSEDKKLLRRCDGAGVPYYNAAMLFLRLRMQSVAGAGLGVQPQDTYRQLCEAARYSQQVLDYLDALDLYLLKQGR
ncbi:MAG: hypothetical protein EA428_01470 [Spirochaetaceae bacterium]|nr:MAG: hypothetical protein EA428_01470 [Spirochaetaceae bacterium]